MSGSSLAGDPVVWPAFVVAAVVVGLAVAVLVVLALDRGDPAETALAYEEAWDRLDFDVLWALSAPELRDGRTRADFVSAKRETYGARRDVGRLVARVRVDRLDSAGRRARAVTRLELRDGTKVVNELRLRRHGWRWVVHDYRLGSQAGSGGPAA